MPTDLEPGWPQRKRMKYNDPIEDFEHTPKRGIVWLSDVLKKIDAKRQTGYNEEDLPPQFEVKRSFIKVPHHLLGKDGYPLGEGWLHPSCQEYLQFRKGKHQGDVGGSSLETTTSLASSSQPEVPGANGTIEAKGEVTEPPFRTVTKRVAASLPSLYDLDHGRESAIVPIPGKVRRGRVTRHPVKAQKSTAARREDLSSAGERAKRTSFKRLFRRFDDPVLPVEDYERTMEIVQKLYHIIDHGHGQLVDPKSQNLICTFSFEDLEAMDEDQRQVHQCDVDTIMKATKIFRQMPITKCSSSSTMIPAYSSSIASTKIRLSTECPTSVETSKPKRLTTAEPSMRLLMPLIRNLKPNNTLKLPSTSNVKSAQPKELAPVLDLMTPPSADLSGFSSPLTSLAPSLIDESEPEDMIFNLPNEKLEQKLEDVLIDHPRQLQNSATRQSSPLTSLEPPEAEDEEGLPLGIEKKITTNGALINGKMFCFGARAGYDPEVLFSPYIPRQGASLSLYKLFLSELPIFGAHMGARFEAFADQAFLTSRKMLRILNAPSLTATDKNEQPGTYDFAGNFAFTFHNFFNKPHTDNDKGKVYGVWYPIDSINGRIVTLSKGFMLEGGYFVFPEYRIGFKFGAKFVVQICWSGKSTFHQTLPSKEEEVEQEGGTKTHFTRLGCSSQITSSLARAAVKLGTEEQHNFTSNCQRKVLDCNDILASDGRQWKA